MELIQAFLDYISLERNYSKHTIISYQTDLTEYYTFIQDTYQSDVKNIHYNQIRTYIVALSNKNLSNRTINRKLSALKSFYKFLLKIEEIKESPLSKHKALKTPKRVNVPFSIKEIDKVLALFLDIDANDFSALRDKTIILLLYSTGIRREELIQLKIEDVDFNQNTIRVIGKRNKERIIPLLNKTQVQLKQYLTERNKIKSANSSLFITDKGKKIYGTFVYRLINYYFSAVTTKVKKSPHILRHAFATHLINEGAEINAVKELLGHASLASTQVYVNSNLKRIKEMYNQAHPRSNKKE
jgi:integrase/recombinase XerC